jgi:hypothetical protein
MFPLVAIAGVVSAVATFAKGASWLAGKLDQAGEASDGGKAGAKPMTAAQAAQFDAVLSAQVAGQSVPVSASMPVNMLPHQSGPDYDSLARMQAGIVAYNHVGEHRGNHPNSPSRGGDATTAARA